MSDETPPLRMKPRLSLSPAKTPPPPAAADSSGAEDAAMQPGATDQAEAPRLRLKPRSAPTIPPPVPIPAPRETVADGALVLPPPPAPSGAPFAPPPPPPGGESLPDPEVGSAIDAENKSRPASPVSLTGPRLTKLPPPPAPPTASDSPFSASPPPPPADEADAVPKLRTKSPFTAEAPAGAPTKAPVIHMRTSVATDAAKLMAAADPATVAVAPPPPTKKKRTGPLIGIAAVVLLGGGAFATYKLYLEPAPPPPVRPLANLKPAGAVTDVATSTAADSKPPLTPSETLNELAAVPANALAKAQAVIDAKRNSEQTRIDLATGETPATSRPVVITDTMIAPGITISTPDTGATPGAGPAFRTFIAEAKVSGVRSGPPVSAFINGRLVRAGQPVDNSLGIGIIFVGANPETRELIFKERAGGTTTRRY